MSDVIANMSMSLDGYVAGPGGYVAGPDGDVTKVFDWRGAGVTPLRAPARRGRGDAVAEGARS